MIGNSSQNGLTPTVKIPDRQASFFHYRLQLGTPKCGINIRSFGLYPDPTYMAMAFSIRCHWR